MNQVHDIVFCHLDGIIMSPGVKLPKFLFIFVCESGELQTCRHKLYKLTTHRYQTLVCQKSQDTCNNCNKLIIHEYFLRVKMENDFLRYFLLIIHKDILGSVMKTA